MQLRERLSPSSHCSHCTYHALFLAFITTCSVLCITWAIPLSEVVNSVRRSSLERMVR